MPAPSIIADQKAELIEVFEKLRRELEYLRQLAVTQITILQNEPDGDIVDTLQLHGWTADEHVQHMVAASAEAAALIAIIDGLWPGGLPSPCP